MLKTINYQGFRNLTDGSLYCIDGINFIIGGNGAGKTNLLEAIFYVSCASSFRIREEKNMITTDRAYLRVTAQSNGTEASIYLDSDQKKLMLGGNEIHLLSEYLGWVGISMLSIDDIWLVRGNPAKRRSYLDWLIAQLKPSYLGTISEYRRTVQQRNRLLIDMKSNGNNDLIDTFDERYIDIANEIYAVRAHFLPQLREKVRFFGSQFDIKQLDIEYQSSSPDMHIDQKLLKNLRRREVMFGHSVVGPHRDDLLITIDQRLCRNYASEGEERVIAIALRLSEAEMLHEQSGNRPVLLLDEVGAELDETKKNKIFSVIRGQIFYASTKLPSYYFQDQQYQIVNIERGSLEISQKN